MITKKMATKKGKKRGPPPTGKGTLIGVRLHPHELTELDAWRDEQADTPGRPEALRRRAGFAAAPVKKGGMRRTYLRADEQSPGSKPAPMKRGRRAKAAR
jgi:hypothetical protein